MLIWNQQEPPPPVAYEISYGEVDVRLDPHFNERGAADEETREAKAAGIEALELRSQE